MLNLVNYSGKGKTEKEHPENMTSPLGTSSLSLENQVLSIVIKKGGNQQKIYTPENEALCISLVPQKRIKPQGLVRSYKWSD
ncbi:hypothetical protein [Methanosarcina barkeri]|uniref:hypothetical protein n=1 Tax=Methanosarcina barkeri TaxID=2208 RepID=UPI00064F5506|nr:hypothetical protein [Methanosarcina barkeri]